MTFDEDIYAEPFPIDPDTLGRLGPLAKLAGTWEGSKGVDIKPKAEGAREQAYVERLVLEPLDPQTNGPQLFYGLRYHQHVVKPGQRKTYHDQVGYWLWEPATQTIIQSLAIPRGQVVMAVGHASENDQGFELVARHDDPSYGIRANPFLEEAFRTLEYRIRVVGHDDGCWAYEQDTILQIRGQSEPFHHTDRNTLTRVASPTPNPLMADHVHRT